MTKTIRAIVGVLLIGAASPLAGPMQSGSVPTGRLDPRIAAAAPQRYKSVRDAKDWENPYLVIRRDGIEVIVKRLPPGRQTVAVADLERTLVGLPVTAWPYGGSLQCKKTAFERVIEATTNGSLTLSRRYSRFSRNWT